MKNLSRIFLRIFLQEALYPLITQFAATLKIFLNLEVIIRAKNPRLSSSVTSGYPELPRLRSDGAETKRWVPEVGIPSIDSGQAHWHRGRTQEKFKPLDSWPVTIGSLPLSWHLKAKAPSPDSKEAIWKIRRIGRAALDQQQTNPTGLKIDS